MHLSYFFSYSLVRRCLSNSIRNVAIIAHVDHGKTTLVDCLINNEKPGIRILDNNEIEKERGITILSKSTFVEYRNHKINIVDTPGHADFGGEVERALSLVDGAILVVDATEGPMSQTKYVLEKALQKNLLFLVVINKVDRDTSRIQAVESEILDLFLQLNAKDFQLNYPTIYSSSKNAWCSKTMPKIMKDFNFTKDMNPLLDEIINHIPGPKTDDSKIFSMLVNSTEQIPFVGKCAFGRINSGSITVGSQIKSLNENLNLLQNGIVQKIFAKRGLENVKDS
jgi:GTP-binding protein